jgi:diguanylate cyclase (GGDEF)-like protein
LALSKPIDKADQRLYLLVGLVLFVGLAAIGWSGAAALADLRDGPDGSVTAVVSLVLLVAVGSLLTVQVRVRSTVHGMAWADTAVVVGLAILPWPWVTVATAVGTAAANAVRRRPPLKFGFGVAKDSVSAFAGGLVLVGLGRPGPLEVADLPSLALAYVAMTLVDELLTIPVIALASRTPVIDRFRANWDIRLITMVGRFVVAILAVLALQLNPTLIYALPLLVLLAHLWQERWVRTREEREAWQNLAAATEAFTGVDLDVVLRESVVRGAKLFSADAIEVEVWLGLNRRLVRGAEEIAYDGDPEQAPSDGANVYAVALHGYEGRRDIGALRLRFRNRIKVSDREQAMVASYAAALDTAVRNAAAYQQLGEATEAHAYAAAHDALTGLANRRELERQLTAALANPTGMDCRVAVVLVDLRHFKEVNDTLGHLAGDRVLVQVAERLSDAAGPRDLVTRFGGDEFAVLLRNAWRPARVEARARRVLRSLAEPLEVDGLPIMVEANGGLALAVDPQDAPELAAVPGDADGGTGATGAGGARPAGHATAGRVAAPPATVPEFRRTPRAWMAELMRRADVAMYQAKRMGQPLVSYTVAQDPADRERLTLAGQLPRAVSEREFVLHFQPIVELATGTVVGAEALARWRHPTRGQLDPRWFLDLLERSAHLPAFTAAVLDDALSTANMWRAAGYDLSVSVNISARSLLDASLPRQILAALDRHRTRPDRLCLELTETLALSQLDTVDQVLTQLHDIGVRLALDDFGTGFSSLAVLSRIPVHELKIDRSFINALRDLDLTAEADPEADAEDIAQAKAVVRSTVQLGRTLDLAVVAEGIETEAQRRLLWELGCATGQGHLFARPQPADRLLAALTRGVDDRPGTIAAPLRSGANVVHLRRARSSGRGTPG